MTGDDPIPMYCVCPSPRQLERQAGDLDFTQPPACAQCLRPVAPLGSTTAAGLVANVAPPAGHWAAQLAIDATAQDTADDVATATDPDASGPISTKAIAQLLRARDDARRLRDANARLVGVIERHRDDAIAKAWANLGRYKFSNFGYWAARVVYLGQLLRECGEPQPANPFKDLVLAAREHEKGGAQ